MPVHVPWPVHDIGVLPLGAGIIDRQAVVVVPWYEANIRRAGRILRRSPVPRVVKIIIGSGRVIVVPAPEQHIDGRPSEESVDVHDAVYRLAEGVRAEAFLAAAQSDAVDGSDETGQVIVGADLGVALVGLEPVGTLGRARDEILPSRVIPVGPDPVFKIRTPDVAVR